MGLLGRGKPIEDEPDPELATVSNTIVGTARQRSLAERDERLAKGIDADMIDPEEVILVLKGIAYETTYKSVPVSIAADGSVILENKPIYKIRPWALACIVYLNKIWATIYMDKFDADTTKIRIRLAFVEIRRAMPYREKKAYGIVVNAAENLALARCEDMKEGRKAMLIKVKRDDVTVNMKKIVGKEKK